MPDEEPEEPAFAHRRYHFTTGLRSGETATIRTEEGEAILTYRSFANITGVIAILVSVIIALAGLGGTALLFAEGAPFRAIAALALTLVFALLILRLVPRVSVSLLDDGRPVLSIVQVASVPTARYSVTTPDGGLTVELARGLFTRLGRNRWRILQEGRLVAEAYESSWSAALVRKLLGKFSRRWESDLVLEYGGMEAGAIRRRPDEQGRFDDLVLTNETLDPRLALALATVVFGSEP